MIYLEKLEDVQEFLNRERKLPIWRKTMEEKQEIKKQSEQEFHRENLRIRKTEWIQEQIQRQRQSEDALFLQMKQEQEVLDTLRDSMNQNMQTTREARKYNQEFQESMDAQVYAMYGISSDKLQGMREYRNAYYQGCAFSLFLLSVILSALCGVLHGLQSQICLFMVAFTAIEGALLTGEGKRGRVLNFCCKLLYLLMFPMMMVIFVCFELKYLEYDLLLPIFLIFGMAALLIGTASYFLHNPYRADRRVVEEAKDTIRDIEKTARKEVKKNRKTREKAERKEIRKRQKSQARAMSKQAFGSFFKKRRKIETGLEEQEKAARVEQKEQTELQGASAEKEELAAVLEPGRQADAYVHQALQETEEQNEGQSQEENEIKIETEVHMENRCQSNRES